MHQGAVIAEKGKYKVIECEDCKFAHLDPLPSGEEMTDFYKNQYYKLIKEGGRAPELRRQMSEKDERFAERNWLEKTLYNDLSFVLNGHIKSSERKIFDIGCGTGELLKYMKNEGWIVAGIEPDSESANSELAISNMSLDEYVEKNSQMNNQYDVITIMSVLEHVPDPRQFLMSAKRLIKPEGGIVCIRVPNDFNVLQLQAQNAINKSLWWVATPDHLNYFNTKSLAEFVESAGFTVLQTTVDFPMELFLLMGDVYVDNADIGDCCHKKRVNFEMSLDDDVRRNFYQKMADMGMGRDCMVFAKVNV